jgi:hypothetical protein
MLTMLLNVAVADYLYTLNGKSPQTKRSAKTILGQFIAWCDVEDVSLEQLTEPLDRLPSNCVGVRHNACTVQQPRTNRRKQRARIG